jgi:hypothetical protein
MVQERQIEYHEPTWEEIAAEMEAARRSLRKEGEPGEESAVDDSQAVPAKMIVQIRPNQINCRGQTY